jgi:hypothetical protein
MMTGLGSQLIATILPIAVGIYLTSLKCYCRIENIFFEIFLVGRGEAQRTQRVFSLLTLKYLH